MLRIHTKIRLLIPVLLLISIQASLEADYKIFYYKDKKVLESRLEFFLNAPGLLVNYPMSMEEKERKLEFNQDIAYTKNLKPKDIKQDIGQAFKAQQYYGLVRIFASIDKPDHAIKAVKVIENLLGEDKYANAICAYSVQRLIKKKLLKIENDKPNLELSRAVTNFVFLLRKRGFEAKKFEALKEIDHQIYEGLLHSLIGD